jgi:hypothetical protein
MHIGFLAKSITSSGQIIVSDQLLPNSSRATIQLRAISLNCRDRASSSARSIKYPAGDAGIAPASGDEAAYSTLMLAALMIGHHFAISDF